MLSNSLDITALYASLCSLIVICLSYLIVRYRRGNKIGIGDGGSHDLQVLIRAQANALEYSCLLFVLLLCAEAGGLADLWLHIAGGLFVLGRIAHAWGFIRSSAKYHIGRFLGTLFSWLIILALSGFNIINFFN